MNALYAMGLVTSVAAASTLIKHYCRCAVRQGAKRTVSKAR